MIKKFSRENLRFYILTRYKMGINIHYIASAFRHVGNQFGTSIWVPHEFTENNKK